MEMAAVVYSPHVLFVLRYNGRYALYNIEDAANVWKFFCFFFTCKLVLWQNNCKFDANVQL